MRVCVCLCDVSQWLAAHSSRLEKHPTSITPVAMSGIFSKFKGSVSQPSYVPYADYQRKTMRHCSGNAACHFGISILVLTDASIGTVKSRAEFKCREEARAGA